MVNRAADAPDVDLGEGICADAPGRSTPRAAIMQANALGGTHIIDLSQINDPNNPMILTICGSGESVAGNLGDRRRGGRYSRCRQG